jgi:hypothetical protein
MNIHYNRRDKQAPRLEVHELNTYYVVINNSSLTGTNTVVGARIRPRVSIRLDPRDVARTPAVRIVVQVGRVQLQHVKQVLQPPVQDLSHVRQSNGLHVREGGALVGHQGALQGGGARALVIGNSRICPVDGQRGAVGVGAGDVCAVGVFSNGEGVATGFHGRHERQHSTAGVVHVQTKSRPVLGHSIRIRSL